MNTIAKFQLWDTTNPTVQEAEMYARRIAGRTPLLLAYSNGVQQPLTLRQSIKKTDAPLCGICIGDKLFYTRGFRYSDYKAEFRKGVPFLQCFRNWLYKNPEFASDAHLITEQEYALLLQTDIQQQWQETLSTLEYHKQAIPSLQICCYLPDKGTCQYPGGAMEAEDYLKVYGGLWIVR